MQRNVVLHSKSIHFMHEVIFRVGYAEEKRHMRGSAARAGRDNASDSGQPTEVDRVKGTGTHPLPAIECVYIPWYYREVCKL